MGNVQRFHSLLSGLSGLIGTRGVVVSWMS